MTAEGDHGFGDHGLAIVFLAQVAGQVKRVQIFAQQVFAESSQSSSLRSENMTLAPSLANSSTSAWPIPPTPPVMTTFLSSNRMFIKILSGLNGLDIVARLLAVCQFGDQFAGDSGQGQTQVMVAEGKSRMYWPKLAASR